MTKTGIQQKKSRCCQPEDCIEKKRRNTVMDFSMMFKESVCVCVRVKRFEEEKEEKKENKRETQINE